MKPIRVRVASNGDHWQFSWTDFSGKRCKAGGGSKAEVSKRQAEQAAAILQGKLNADARGRLPENMTLARWRELFFETRRSELKAKTVKLYGGTFDHLERIIGSDRKILSIRPTDGSRWRSELKDELGLSEATVSSHCRHAKHVFAWAIKLGVLRENPFLHLKVTEGIRGAKQYIDREATGKLLEAAPDIHWRRAIALCRYAGLRYGEMQRLVRDDVRGSALHIRPEDGIDGTKQRLRVVPVTADLSPYLQDLSGGPVCLGIPEDNRYGNFTMRRVIRDAGLERYPKPFHSLRASCEDDWMAKYPVMDVCRWLGHSPAVAMKHYQSTTPEVWARATAAGTDSLMAR